jgi:uncharacterized protein involved in cysteine biosynthesis
MELMSGVAFAILSQVSGFVAGVFLGVLQEMIEVATTKQKPLGIARPRGAPRQCEKGNEKACL